MKDEGKGCRAGSADLRGSNNQKISFSDSPKLTIREGQAHLKVIGIEIGHFRENLLSRETGCKKIEHIADANSHSANARASAALFGVDGDSSENGSHITMKNETRDRIVPIIASGNM
jgi:hypothetical protein